MRPPGNDRQDALTSDPRVPGVNETVYARAPGVVWRLGPDRVLVRRVHVHDRQSLDLHGAVALVWISLDQPGTKSDIVERVGARLEIEAHEALRLLLAEELITVKPIGLTVP